MTLAHLLVTQIAYAFAAAITSADSGAMLSAPFVQQRCRAHLDSMDQQSAVAVHRRVANARIILVKLGLKSCRSTLNFIVATIAPKMFTQFA